MTMGGTLINDAATAPVPDDDTDPDEARVQDDLNRVKGFVGGLAIDDLRDGTWFAKLLTFSLDAYVNKVDAAYFARKYPHLPADAVVEARIQLAARYAGVEGGLSAGAYTGAIAATITSGGGASPLTLPAAGATFAVDLVFSSQLQLRLAYDIAVLYRVPLDLEDPEDLWKLIRVAFGIHSSEVGRGLVGKGVPMAVRPLVKKFFSGSTLATVRSLPVFGKYLLRRNIIKFAIPVVGVPVSVGMNYWTTKLVGRHARAQFRNEASIVEIARRMIGASSQHAELLWVLWLVIAADGKIHEDERLLLHHVTKAVADRDADLPDLADLESTVNVDEQMVWRRLRHAQGDTSPLYDAAVTAAAIDGTVSKQELACLKELALHCSTHYDEDAVKQGASSRG